MNARIAVCPATAGATSTIAVTTSQRIRTTAITVFVRYAARSRTTAIATGMKNTTTLSDGAPTDG
jgi:hypothetical protein